VKKILVHWWLMERITCVEFKMFSLKKQKQKQKQNPPRMHKLCSKKNSDILGNHV
jgi:hypothetical protein